MTKVRQSEQEKAVINVLTYFDYFNYSPSFYQIHTFLPVKISKNDLKTQVQAMVKSAKILQGKLTYTGEGIYSLPDRKGYFTSRSKRYEITQRKLKKINRFVTYIKSMPWIDFIGVSGSCSTDNAGDLDDIDVFIISAPGGMWLARLSAVLTAKLLNMHRKRGARSVADKVCLNLFFDGSSLAVPKQKRNLYTAHEVVQIVPIHVRGGVYKRFMFENSWIQKYFPNVQILKPLSVADSTFTPIIKLLNSGAKQLQIDAILSHRTTETISDQQLWFFPDDFEKKIKKDINIHP